jgi:hypothetical protein
MIFCQDEFAVIEIQRHLIALEWQSDVYVILSPALPGEGSQSKLKKIGFITKSSGRRFAADCFVSGYA